ncbi:MAG: hypothetical protein LBL82_00780 [Oscillospiraceae bacterium]|nr:hypothetical protein [Oscillospiraceae bacterium]
MNEYFEIVRTKLANSLAEKGYSANPAKSEGDTESICFTTAEDGVILEYKKDENKFFLSRFNVEDGEDSAVSAQISYFSEEAGYGKKDAESIAGEFVETLTSPTSKSAKERLARAVASTAKKESAGSEDNVTPKFFINRIPTYLPDCRLALIAHKEHYETLLPVKFCEEVVVESFNNMLDTGEQSPDDFLLFLSNSHEKGDLSTKGLIVQIILNSVNSRHWDYLSDKMSDSLKKAWNAGKRYIGKEVEPEKEKKPKKSLFSEVSSRLGQ